MASDKDCGAESLTRQSGDLKMELPLSDVENRMRIISDKLAISKKVLDDLNDLNDLLVRKSLQDVTLSSHK